ncbi:hypothetical protein KIN20_011403 [Parelaphostrongylus tenuis]|uniref:Uncharacterized protein n=1 Tax=Parelaphostrongylus tenuis TaxID=148309 RepID=A0AAD5QPU9_PARTN|nr:hypothetical protein KIN20_011403 [Parelaphostrongylus tenuis]
MILRHPEGVMRSRHSESYYTHFNSVERVGRPSRTCKQLRFAHLTNFVLPGD